MMPWANYVGKNSKGRTICHIVPEDDTFDHDLDITCWCQPEVDIEDDSVVVHNAHDQRDLYETGKRKLM